MSCYYDEFWSHADRVSAEERHRRSVKVSASDELFEQQYSNFISEIAGGLCVAEVDLSFLLKEFTTNENPDRAAT